MRNKIVTFFLHDHFDKKKGGYGNADASDLFGVKDHLTEYLDDGWTVKDLRTLGGAGGCLSGWVVAVLEKLA